MCDSDWSQQHQIPGCTPSIGTGLRKIFRRAHFEIRLVNEFRTSCTCSSCGGITQKCIKSVNLKNRDVNGAINILQIAKCELSGNPNPAQFCRTKNNSTNSGNEY